MLLAAFENVAGHISNLELVKEWIEEMLSEKLSLEDSVAKLRERSAQEDVTVMTDIRILINEIEHISREKTSG